MLALRNVMRTARRSAMLGCTAGVGAIALILFVGYITASLYGLRESTIRSGIGHLQIFSQDKSGDYSNQQLQFGLEKKEFENLKEILMRDFNVRRIVPRLTFDGLISNGPHTLNFQAVGVDPKNERQAFGAFQNLVSGHHLLSTEKGKYQALLGSEMAKRLGVSPGDSVTIITSTISGSINAIDLEVCGLISTGVPETDLYFLQLPLQSAQELLRTTKLSYLAVLLANTDLTESSATLLHSKLKSSQEVKTWSDIVPLYHQVLSLYVNQFAVFGIIIGIVIFLSVSTMTLNTLYERKKEIGILRSMGISVAAVRLLFVYESFIQSLVGSLTGAVIAWILIVLINLAKISLAPPPGRNIAVMLNLQWIPSYAMFIIIVLLLVAMLASWLVTGRIGKMPVVNSLSSH